MWLQQLSMGFSKTQLKYYLTNFRTRKSYLLFQFLQLLIAIAVIVRALTSQIHFREPLVLYLEFLLLFLMTFDLLIVRGISEGSLWKSKTNRFDCIVLLIFMVTFVFLTFTEKQMKTDQKEGKKYQEMILETDDIIIIMVVMCRYLVQIYRIIMTILNTRRNMLIQRKIKQIDLNGIQMTYDSQFQQDAIVRAKITSKMSQRDRIEEKVEEEIA